MIEEVVKNKKRSLSEIRALTTEYCMSMEHFPSTELNYDQWTVKPLVSSSQTSFLVNALRSISIRPCHHNASIVELLENAVDLSDAEIVNPRKRDELINEILAFRSLNENWDGNGAYPLEVLAAANAIKFINEIPVYLLSRISVIQSTPNGTIAISWENGFNERLSLEIGNNTFSYYIKLNSLETEFFRKIPFTSKDISICAKNIQRLFAR